MAACLAIMVYAGTKLFLARIYQPDLSEVAGDYPIITSEKTSKLLSNGIYITTVPYEMPGMEYVKKLNLYIGRVNRENTICRHGTAASTNNYKIFILPNSQSYQRGERGNE